MATLLNGCLADTDYFEIDAKSGRRFGVWVTVPPGYSESDDDLPLIYVVDGNWAVGLTAPLIVTQGDPYLRVRPYIQVSVGYTDDDAENWAQLRNRDLVPPGEPVGEEMLATIASARESGAMTDEEADAYLAELVDTRADLFLDFLTTELHPRLRTEYRVSETGHGLFGYSYGGLFALYAWLRRESPFSTFGAGTPGVATENSTAFEMLADRSDGAKQESAPRLHLTLNEREVFGDIAIYRQIARNALNVLDELKRTMPHAVSSELMQQTHVTGLQASFLSYLGACHSDEPS